MANGHVRYLLVGGGAASSAAAEAIRARDSAGDIVLIEREVSRPYHRPPLSMAYLRREGGEMFTHPAEWYATNNVRLRTGRRVGQLDLPRHRALIDDGTEIAFDRLLIATGASAAATGLPGEELPGAMGLRSLEDADRISHAIDVAQAAAGGAGRGARAVVAGGGLLAGEIAASLAVRGMAVTLVSGRKWLWEGLAGEYVGRRAERLLEQAGVEVRTASPLRRLAGDGRVQRVEVGGVGPAVVACDFAVLAEGWAPNKELLRGTAVAAEKAILTDARCLTNVAGVYAAGECAAPRDPVFGRHRLADHWDTAGVMGAVAGACMAADEGYGASPGWAGVTVHRTWAASTPAVVMGEPRLADRRVARDGGERGIVEFGVSADGRVCAAVLLGWLGDAAAVEAMVRGRAEVAGREDQLRDPAVPL